MKFSFLILCFSFSLVYGEGWDRVEALSSKVILENKDGYFALSDGSLWKVVGFNKRWRSFSEWWNGVALVPENYECTPNDWYIGAHIGVYSKRENLVVDTANASNQDVLKRCTHLLVNTNTDQVLFAISLCAGECILQLSKESYEEGYREGKRKGFWEASDKAEASYQRGYADGLKSGYAEGYQSAMKEEGQ